MAIPPKSLSSQVSWSNLVPALGLGLLRHSILPQNVNPKYSSPYCFFVFKALRFAVNPSIIQTLYRIKLEGSYG